MIDKLELIKDENISSKIYNIRGLQVMLDSELAELYGVETKVFNQAVKRNEERFPENFRVQLTEEEFKHLRSQSATSSEDKFLRSQIVTLEKEDLKSQGMLSEDMRGKHRKYLPYVFTEQGVSMLSAVLKSPTAIEMSIKIINSFVEMRRFLSSNGELFQRLDLIEKRQLAFEMKTDDKFDKIFSAIESNEVKPKQGIFFDGQIFDAYTFVTDLIKSAKSSIILIDNYIDETVLTMLSKREKGCIATIYTKTISEALKLDLKKHNSQYPSIEIKNLSEAHDRFIIIDDKEIYHIGASLKDLGKKWFAFSKFDINAFEILNKLKSY